MTSVTVLTGHTSPETAYVVEDYPYKRSQRCRKRYWLEHVPGRGYRLCAQTESPRTKRWGELQRSACASLAGALYLDRMGHLKWRGVGHRTPAEDVLAYVREFPEQTGSLSGWVATQVQVHTRIVASIDGGEAPGISPADGERARAALRVWREIAEILG